MPGPASPSQNHRWLRASRATVAWVGLMFGLPACGLPAEGLEPGSCADRVDNDGDFSFDCDDPGCAAAPECAGALAGNTDTGPDPAAPAEDTGEAPVVVDGSCNENTYTLTFEDGTQQVLNAWVWQEGWGGAHLLGLTTDGDTTGCAVATEFFTEFTGYDTWFFQIDLPTIPGAGDVVRIQGAESAAGIDGTARLENLSTGALETSEDGGRMAVQQAELNGTFIASDVYTRMSGGTAPQGDVVACWCAATPIGPEPDADGGSE